MQNKKLAVIEERKVLGKEFKIYGTVDDPLFLAKDVAEMIDYTKTGKGSYDVSKMLSKVDEDEKVLGTNINRTQNKRGGLRENTERWFLTEDGLYEVLMQSRKPIAKQFKKEVKTILKTIRKHGAYIGENADVEYVNNELRFSEKRTINSFANCKSIDEAEKLYEDFRTYVDKEYKNDTKTRIARYKSVEKGLNRLHKNLAQDDNNIGKCHSVKVLLIQVLKDRTTLEKRVIGGKKGDSGRRLACANEEIDKLKTQLNALLDEDKQLLTIK